MTNRRHLLNDYERKQKIFLSKFLDLKIQLKMEPLKRIFPAMILSIFLYAICSTAQVSLEWASSYNGPGGSDDGSYTALHDQYIYVL